MKLIHFVNNSYRTKTVKDILVGGNTDGEDGLSWKEVNKLIKEGHNPKSLIFGAAKLFWGVDGMTNSVFKAMDENKDGIISLTECDKYAQKECDISLKDIWNETVEQVCNRLDNAPKKSNKKEPQGSSLQTLNINS